MFSFGEMMKADTKIELDNENSRFSGTAGLPLVSQVLLRPSVFQDYWKSGIDCIDEIGVPN